MGTNFPILDMIDQFLEERPDFEFGTGHVVLGDYNIDDHNLDFSIALTLDVIANYNTPDQATDPFSEVFLEETAREDWSVEDHQRVLAFLEKLRRIPIEDRQREMDMYFGYDEEDEEDPT